MARRQNAENTGDNVELQALFDSISEQAGKPQLEVVASSTGAGDTDELQELFDAVVAKGKALESPAAKSVAAPPPVMAKAANASDGGDSSELEALFDEVASDRKSPVSAAASAGPTAEEKQEHVFNRIGQMTRLLHDTIRELGYDKMLEETAQKLPDARQRLSYISQMTEQAASRVLNATDIAKPIQEKLEKSSAELNARWAKLYAKQLSVEEFKQLAGDTRNFLDQTSSDSKLVNAQLLEIMMAQDFQDLTGQVIKKIVDMAATLENELLKVLIEVVPEEKRKLGNEGLLNGPVINGEGRVDVVTSQEQVDDLLESLGF